MGVAPYPWPHQQNWQPGVHDKRSNLGMWFVLIIYLVFFIGFTLNVGPQLLASDLLPVFVVLVILLGVIVALFLMGQAVRREVRVEELKYFDIAPERLSQVLAEALDLVNIRYRRDGPKRVKEDYWEDAFHLTGPTFEGITLVVERNPLIARVDKASVTIRGTSRSIKGIDKVKELVDGAAMRELLDRYESDRREDRPDLVVYGEE